MVECLKWTIEIKWNQNSYTFKTFATIK